MSVVLERITCLERARFCDSHCAEDVCRIFDFAKKQVGVRQIIEHIDLKSDSKVPDHTD